MAYTESDHQYWLEKSIDEAGAGRYEPALRYLDKAALIAPAKPYLWYSRPMLCIPLGRLEEMKFFNQMYPAGSREKPETVPAFFAKGLAHYAKKENEPAAGCFRRVLAAPYLPAIVPEVIARLFREMGIPITEPAKTAGPAGNDPDILPGQPGPGKREEQVKPDAAEARPSGTQPGGDGAGGDPPSPPIGLCPGPGERLPPVKNISKRLIGGQDDPGSTIRARAAGSLGELGYQDAVPHLIRALREDPEPLVRISAAGAPAHLRRPEAEDALLARLSDSSGRVRNKAACELRDFRSPAVTRALAALMQDPDPEVRSAARYSLRIQKDPGAIGPLIRHFTASHGHETAALVASYGTAAVPELARCLSDENRLARLFAAIALRGIPGPASVDLLTQALADIDPAVRLHAIEGLAGLDAPGWPGLVEQVLKDGDEISRGHVVEALSKLPGSRSRSLLIAALRDPALPVRSLAVSKIRRYRDSEIILPLAAVLDDPFEETALLAAVHLGSLGYPAFFFLADALGRARKDPAQKACRQGLLGYSDASSAVALHGLLYDARWNVRAAAAYALSHLREAGAFCRLTELLSDEHPEVRLAAVTALESFGTEDAVEAIRARAQDPDKEVRDRIEGVLRMQKTGAADRKSKTGRKGAGGNGLGS